LLLFFLTVRSPLGFDFSGIGTLKGR
jgi:hypothetical protein